MSSGKILQLVSVIALIALAAVVVTIIVTGGVDEIRIGKSDPEPGTIEDVEELPEEATRTKPISTMEDPKLEKNVTKTMAMSYYNIGFEECENEGARVRVEPDKNIDLTYQSKIVKIPVDEAEYVPFTIKSEAKPSPYRVTFEVICDETKVAKSSITLRVRR